VVAVENSKLDRAFNKLDGEYEGSVASAEETPSGIEDIERVAEDLFEEWEEELKELSSTKLCNQSPQLAE